MDKIVQNTLNSLVITQSEIYDSTYSYNLHPNECRQEFHCYTFFR